MKWYCGNGHLTKERKDQTGKIAMWCISCKKFVYVVYHKDYWGNTVAKIKSDMRTLTNEGHKDLLICQECGKVYSRWIVEGNEKKSMGVSKCCGYRIGEPTP